MSKNAFHLLVLCGVLMFWNANASSITSDAQFESTPASQEKIYFSLDHLCITEEGMFVDVLGEPKSVEALYRDNSGYYILARRGEEYQCPYGLLLQMEMVVVTNGNVHLLEINKI